MHIPICNRSVLTLINHSEAPNCLKGLLEQFSTVVKILDPEIWHHFGLKWPKLIPKPKTNYPQWLSTILHLELFWLWSENLDISASKKAVTKIIIFRPQSPLFSWKVDARVIVIAVMQMFILVDLWVF